MKVINRKQIEEVVIKRCVSHIVELNGKRYSRSENVKVHMPNSGCDVLTEKPTVKWQEYVKKNVVCDLTKKEVKELGLDEAFSKIDIDSYNGNNY